MTFDVVRSTMQNLTSLLAQVQRTMGLYTDRSIEELTQLTKVEPYVIISRECRALEAMPDIMNTVLIDVVVKHSAAMNILNRVSNVEVIRKLEMLNPGRDATGMLLAATLTTESRNVFSLPTDNGMPVALSSVVASFENKVGNDVMAEAVNLAVGKLVNTEVGAPTEQNPNNTVTLPINYRLIPNFISTSSLMNILGQGRDDTGLFARGDRMLMGGIRPIMDFFLAEDLIRENRKALITDDSRTLSMIMQRVSTNKKYGMLTNNPSLNNMANIFIITSEEATQLKSVMGGSLENASVRKRIFENVYANTLIVVDRGNEYISIWGRDMPKPSEFSFRQLKARNSGRGVDLMDQLRTFNMGISPSM